MEYAALPAPLPAKLSSHADVVDLTDELPLLEELIGEEGHQPPVRELVLRDADDVLAESLLVDRAWLQEVIELLRDRRQVILYGPPGDVSTPYVLIIDEINRANLAKVFGELYFLLEYRDQAVGLLYSAGDEDDFTLPENVFLIGTMNTADRSIALVDAAMRRRFAFVSLHPTDEPVRGLLSRWLDRHGLPGEAAALLAALNARVPDADFAVGPSYLMRPSV